jgi:hypothetical protein
MEKAGMPVAQSRLREMAHDALTKHHGNVDKAMKTFEASVRNDADALRELLRPYLQNHFEQNFPRPGHSVRDTHQMLVGRGNGGGQAFVASQRSSAPAEPSPAQRRAAASVAKVVAITVLDTFKVRDGRSIGDVRHGELGRMASTNLREAKVFTQIMEFASAPSDAKVRDIISAKELQRMIQKAAEYTDAP